MFRNSGAMARLGPVALAVCLLGLWLALLMFCALGDASDNTALIPEKWEPWSGNVSCDGTVK